MTTPSPLSPSHEDKLHQAKRLRHVFITLFFLTVSIGLTVYFWVGQAGASPTNIMVVTLMNINATLVLWLLLLLSRNAIKFYFERKQKQARIKTKLVAALLSIALIPTLLLSIVASGLLTRSVENWFSTPVEQALDDALYIAQEYYEEKRGHVPRELIEKMERVEQAAAGYKQRKVFKTPIKISYMLSFFVIVLLVIFAAVWFGFYLARSISIPIQKLAEGTQAVASGDLDFKIDVRVTDELGTLVDSFNRMTTELKQSRAELTRAQRLAAWKEVAQQIAHDVKNPLTPIQLATERLRKKYAQWRGTDLPSSVQEGSPSPQGSQTQDFHAIFDECTQTIIHEVEGMKTLVNEFSKFARMPAPHLVRQRIEPIVREVVRLYEAGHENIVIQSQFDPALPEVNLDREQMKRVFINLFDNAIEAMDHKGRIVITVAHRAGDKQVWIDVADEGRGIAQEDLEDVFLPYFSKKKKGTGLGLAMVYRMVSDHNGHIYASQRPRKGTCVTIKLPEASASA